MLINISILLNMYFIKISFYSYRVSVIYYKIIIKTFEIPSQISELILLNKYSSKDILFSIKAN